MCGIFGIFISSYGQIQSAPQTFSLVEPFVRTLDMETTTDTNPPPVLLSPQPTEKPEEKEIVWTDYIVIDDDGEYD
jgi:hypothetical protein